MCESLYIRRQKEAMDGITITTTSWTCLAAEVPSRRDLKYMDSALRVFVNSRILYSMPCTFERIPPIPSALASPLQNFEDECVRGVERKKAMAVRLYSKSMIIRGLSFYATSLPQGINVSYVAPIALLRNRFSSCIYAV